MLDSKGTGCRETCTGNTEWTIAYIAYNSSQDSDLESIHVFGNRHNDPDPSQGLLFQADHSIPYTVNNCVAPENGEQESDI